MFSNFTSGDVSVIKKGSPALCEAAFLLCLPQPTLSVWIALLLQGFIAVGGGTENDLGDGLGGVGDCGIDDAGLHGYAVDGRESESDDEMECSYAAGNGNCETESADKGKEQGIDHIKMAQERCGPDGAGCHEPIHNPYEGSVCKEHPFAVHVQAAREALQ